MIYITQNTVGYQQLLLQHSDNTTMTKPERSLQVSLDQSLHPYTFSTQLTVQQRLKVTEYNYPFQTIYGGEHELITCNITVSFTFRRLLNQSSNLKPLSPTDSVRPMSAVYRNTKRSPAMYYSTAIVACRGLCTSYQRKHWS